MSYLENTSSCPTFCHKLGQLCLIFRVREKKEYICADKVDSWTWVGESPGGLLYRRGLGPLPPYLLVCKTFWLSVAFGSFISAVRLEVNYLIIQLTVEYWLAQATRHNQ